ncbi:MAG: hypothetical protein ACIARR_10625 [Phycisphaerales bacterium JB059]
MHADSPTRTISAVMGLTAFSLALIAGWAVHNPLDTVLTRAIIAMVVCYAVGQVIGWAASLVVREHLAQHRAANPVPTGGNRTEPDAETAQDSRNPHTLNQPTAEPEPSRAAA